MPANGAYDPRDGKPQKKNKAVTRFISLKEVLAKAAAKEAAETEPELEAISDTGQSIEEYLANRRGRGNA